MQEWRVMTRHSFVVMLGVGGGNDAKTKKRVVFQPLLRAQDETRTHTG